jgi:hypothetical protein
MIDKAIELAAGWASSAAAGALGGMAKQLITGWVGSSAGGALIKEAIEAAGAGIPDARAKVEREAFNTALRWLIRQLDDPTMRQRLAPLAKLGTDKPLEKELLGAVASILVDPAVAMVKQEVKARLISSGHQLLVAVKGAGVPVTGGALSLSATSVTLPAAALASLEAGVAVETSAIDAVEFEKIAQLKAAWHNARAIAMLDGRASQRRLVGLWNGADVDAYEREYNAYNSRVILLLRSLFAVAQTMVTGSLSGNNLVLPRLTIEDPRHWEQLQIYSNGPGQPAQFRVVVAWDPPTASDMITA